MGIQRINNTPPATTRDGVAKVDFSDISDHVALDGRGNILNISTPSANSLTDNTQTGLNSRETSTGLHRGLANRWSSTSTLEGVVGNMSVTLKNIYSTDAVDVYLELVAHDDTDNILYDLNDPDFQVLSRVKLDSVLPTTAGDIVVDMGSVEMPAENMQDKLSFVVRIYGSGSVNWWRDSSSDSDWDALRQTSSSQYGATWGLLSGALAMSFTWTPAVDATSAIGILAGNPIAWGDIYTAYTGDVEALVDNTWSAPSVLAGASHNRVPVRLKNIEVGDNVSTGFAYIGEPVAPAAAAAPTFTGTDTGSATTSTLLDITGSGTLLLVDNSHNSNAYDFWVTIDGGTRYRGHVPGGQGSVYLGVRFETSLLLQHSTGTSTIDAFYLLD